LEERVAILVKERDDALVVMSNAREQAEQNAQSMRNLQVALEHLQKGSTIAVLNLPVSASRYGACDEIFFSRSHWHYCNSA